MVRVLEVVLDVVASAERRGRKADVRLPGFAGKLVSALPQLGTFSAQGIGIETVTFDHERVLTDAGWRVSVETQGDVRRVMVASRIMYTPGVVASEVVFEAPLDAAGMASAWFDAAPAPFREALAQTGEIAPAATLTCVRSRWPWTRDGVDVELVLDADVRVVRHDDPLLHELRLRAPWPEDGDAAPVLDVLFARAKELADVVPAFVRIDDALDRTARGDVAGNTTPVRAATVDLGRARTTHDALVAIGRNICAQWFGNDAGVRDYGSTEFIHQMRVAQRRLRTAMRIFRKWQDDEWSTHIKPDLRWLGELLGDARDRDVFVESTLPELAAADTDAARWDAIRDAANAARLAARARVREALASSRYTHLVIAWLRWLASLALRGGHAGPADSLHQHAKKRVKRYYRELAEMPKLTEVDESARHRTRIAAKYLRYTLEFFAPLVTRSTRVDVARGLSRLQSVLGDGNDAAVALRYLEQMDVEPYQLGLARGWCEAVKRYTAKEGERLLRELPPPKIAGKD